ncbi:AAA domain-containing protein [Clostridium sp. LP20]|uniref:DEAD/DEAH box helicase n=1 Tax=Clostridium sp. LP20 TaxID=3418665 RepID=UPI003EE567A0
MRNIKNILEYWYSIEFFAPSQIKRNNDAININKDTKALLPWENKKKNYDAYDVYLGELQSDKLLKEMFEKLKLDDTLMERENTRSCICGFKVDSKGSYVEGTFIIATFVWAVAKILREKTLDVNLTEEGTNKFNEEVNEVLKENKESLDRESLYSILSEVTKRLELKVENPNFNVGIINPRGKKREGEDESSNEMMSSFFTKDIRLIKNSISSNDKLVRYINGLNDTNTKRIEIDTDVEEMQKWLSPDKYPLGKWPSPYSPSLMQQIAINMAIANKKSGEEIFSVNGPPGTGKTTLLKEVIASYIVDRANLLSNYANPDDAFNEANFKFPPNEFLKKYYKVDENLCDYGILVASNNNAAVENISKDLPKAEDVKETNTGLFNIESNKEIYFSDIATELIGEECWGLISARLGKKSNIDEFKNNLWFGKKANLQNYYKDNSKKLDWEDARDNFKDRLNKVTKYREKIKIALNDVKDNYVIKKEYGESKERIDELRLKLTNHDTLVANVSEAIMRIETHKESIKKNIAILNENISFIKRILPFLFTKDKTMLRLNELKSEYTDINIKLVDENCYFEKLNKERAEINNEYNKCMESSKDLQEKYNDSCEKLEKYEEQFGKAYADAKFYKDIVNNEESQTQSPWTNKEYDKLREELFYSALMLHKSFILNSKAIKNNLNCLVNMWSNKFLKDDMDEAFSDVFNTLFLVVPVISTTFASVQSFLKNVKKESIGTLIIDESGQATPQSALGALWRTKKAIIVGDPLQVEPVVTASRELSKQFIKKLGINGFYFRQELSVQELADKLNPYGGYRNGLWVGCPLIVHRRCIDPMFSISNRIAYENRMFKQTNEKKLDSIKLSLTTSWIDIKGKEVGNKNHFIKEEGDKVVELVLKAFNDNNGFPDLYIISPFTSVISGVKELLEEKLKEEFPELNKDLIRGWISKSCGTVHTFQGKEANEVILILGCDNMTGVSAANWAGSKPNILNVAVTRGKYRVVIIGNCDVWKNIANFDVAYEVLK